MPRSDSLLQRRPSRRSSSSFCSLRGSMRPFGRARHDDSSGDESTPRRGLGPTSLTLAAAKASSLRPMRTLGTASRSPSLSRSRSSSPPPDERSSATHPVPGRPAGISVDTPLWTSFDPDSGVRSAAPGAARPGSPLTSSAAAFNPPPGEEGSEAPSGPLERLDAHLGSMGHVGLANLRRGGSRSSSCSPPSRGSGSADKGPFYN